MYYRKKQSHISRKKGRVYVYDFSNGISTTEDKKLVPLYTATCSFNTDFKSGVLKDGFGICVADFLPFETPKFSFEKVAPLKLYYYKKYDEKSALYVDYLLIYANDGNIYQAILGQNNAFEIVEELHFSSVPNAVLYTYNESNVIIFSLDNLLKVYDGEKVLTVTDAPSISSVCIHNERLFATEGGQMTKLWFSDDFDPLNWNVSLEDAGYIDLRGGGGSLLKVLSFNGYVYAFRKYGISRITAFGDQTTFSVDEVTASTGKIAPNSIAVCGDRIIYLAKEGFYSFSGGTPKRVLTKLDGLLAKSDFSYAKGIFYNGDYYCILQLKDEMQENYFALLRYKTTTGEFSISRYLNVIDFALMEGEQFFKLLFICADNELVGELSQNSEYFNQVLLKTWESGQSDFGIKKEKVLTKLYVSSKTPLRVIVKSEKGSRNLYYFGGISKECLPVSLKGEYFSIYLECESANCNVSYLCCEYEYEGG